MTRAQNGERDPLEKPWVRRALQEDLAKSGKSQADLAKKYGTSQPAISKFRTRHRATIDAIIEDSANEYAGILLADKRNRIETYSDMIIAAEERGDWKAVARLGHQIADEMGHLPGRVTLSGEVGTTTKYTIEGVDPEDLK